MDGISSADVMIAPAETLKVAAAVGWSKSVPVDRSTAVRVVPVPVIAPTRPTEPVEVRITPSPAPA